MRKSTLVAAALIVAAASAVPVQVPAEGAAQAPEAPGLRPELGRVAWERDLDAALARAGETGRPALILFQEVPG